MNESTPFTATCELFCVIQISLAGRQLFFAGCCKNVSPIYRLLFLIYRLLFLVVP